MFPAAHWRPPSAKYRFGGYHTFCAILFHIIVYCRVDQHVCTFRCVNQNCRMTFTPACVCAFLGCSHFLCKCMCVVSILPLPHHPIRSRPQDTLSLGANRPLSLSRLPLSPALPWSGLRAVHDFGHRSQAGLLLSHVFFQIVDPSKQTLLAPSRLKVRTPIVQYDILRFTSHHKSPNP